MAQEISSSSDRAPEEPSERPPQHWPPQLCWARRDRTSALVVCPQTAPIHISPAAAGQGDGDLGLPGHPSFPTMSGACAGFTAEASSTVSIWSPRPWWCERPSVRAGLRTVGRQLTSQLQGGSPHAPRPTCPVPGGPACAIARCSRPSLSWPVR